MSVEEITFIQAEHATDVDTLVKYCKQGALDNIHKNGGSLSDWEYGGELIATYLDHNKVADKYTLIVVEFHLTNWLQRINN